MIVIVNNSPDFSLGFTLACRWDSSVKKYKGENFHEDLIQILKKTQEAKELNLNANAFARLRKRALKELLEYK